MVQDEAVPKDCARMKFKKTKVKSLVCRRNELGEQGRQRGESKLEDHVVERVVEEVPRVAPRGAPNGG